MMEKAKAAAVAGVSSATKLASDTVHASLDALRKRQVKDLSPEQQEQVRALFDESDVTKCGTIDQVELRAAIEKFTGKWLSDAELASFWDQVNRSGAERLGYEDFLLAVGPEMFPPTSVLALRSAGAKAGELKGVAMEKIGDQTSALTAQATDALMKKVLTAVSGAVVKQVADPDMPAVLQRAAAKAVAVVMADVEIEVKEAVSGLWRTVAVEEAPPPPGNPCLRALQAARAWYLYTLFPHDQTIWLQLRNPAFYFLKAVSVFPLYGVQPIFFILHFLVMDRSDEYQLVFYILLFKGSQFISVGLIGTLLGSAWYFGNGCDTDFPISLYAVLLFCAQIVVVWGAWLLLPYTSEKGRPKYKPLPGEEPEQQAGTVCGVPYYKGRGGRLRGLLLHDLAIFAIVVALGIAGFILNASRTRTLEVIYWCRTLYGLFSYPFAVFVLPVVGAVLTHSLPTAYDSRGRCVKVLSPRERERVRAERQAVAEKKRDARELARRAKQGSARVAPAANITQPSSQA